MAGEERKSSTNTFTGGLVQDLNPLTTPENILVDAKNATILTFEGDEYLIQNDMGNTPIVYSNEENEKILTQLPPGYFPVAIKEFNEIFYIIALREDDNFDPKNPKYLTCLGTFPAPGVKGEYDTESNEIIFGSFLDGVASGKVSNIDLPRYSGIGLKDINPEFDELWRENLITVSSNGIIIPYGELGWITEEVNGVVVEVTGRQFNFELIPVDFNYKDEHIDNFPYTAINKNFNLSPKVNRHEAPKIGFKIKILDESGDEVIPNSDNYSAYSNYFKNIRINNLRYFDLNTSINQPIETSEIFYFDSISNIGSGYITILPGTYNGNQINVLVEIISNIETLDNTKIVSFNGVSTLASYQSGWETDETKLRIVRCEQYINNEYIILNPDLFIPNATTVQFTKDNNLKYNIDISIFSKFGQITSNKQVSIYNGLLDYNHIFKYYNSFNSTQYKNYIDSQLIQAHNLELNYNFNSSIYKTISSAYLEIYDVFSDVSTIINIPSSTLGNITIPVLYCWDKSNNERRGIPTNYLNSDPRAFLSNNNVSVDQTKILNYQGISYHLAYNREYILRFNYTFSDNTTKNIFKNIYTTKNVDILNKDSINDYSLSTLEYINLDGKASSETMIGSTFGTRSEQNFNENKELVIEQLITDTESKSYIIYNPTNYIKNAFTPINFYENLEENEDNKGISVSIPTMSNNFIMTSKLDWTKLESNYPYMIGQSLNQSFLYITLYPWDSPNVIPITNIYTGTSISNETSSPIKIYYPGIVGDLVLYYDYKNLDKVYKAENVYINSFSSLLSNLSELDLSNPLDSITIDASFNITTNNFSNGFSVSNISDGQTNKNLYLNTILSTDLSASGESQSEVIFNYCHIANPLYDYGIDLNKNDISNFDNGIYNINVSSLSEDDKNILYMLIYGNHRSERIKTKINYSISPTDISNEFNLYTYYKQQLGNINQEKQEQILRNLYSFTNEDLIDSNIVRYPNGEYNLFDSKYNFIYSNNIINPPTINPNYTFNNYIYCVGDITPSLFEIKYDSNQNVDSIDLISDGIKSVNELISEFAPGSNIIQGDGTKIPLYTIRLKRTFQRVQREDLNPVNNPLNLNYYDSKYYKDNKWTLYQGIDKRQYPYLLKDPILYINKLYSLVSFGNNDTCFTNGNNSGTVLLSIDGNFSDNFIWNVTSGNNLKSEIDKWNSENPDILISYIAKDLTGGIVTDKDISTLILSENSIIFTQKTGVIFKYNNNLYTIYSDNVIPINIVNTNSDIIIDLINNYNSSNNKLFIDITNLETLIPGDIIFDNQLTSFNGEVIINGGSRIHEYFIEGTWINGNSIFLQTYNQNNKLYQLSF